MLFIERILRLIVYFQELERKIDLSTLSSRKISQKITYFIQEFGLNLNYVFNWYIYGPYSPELARESYEIYSTGDPLISYENELPKLQPPEKEILKKIKNFLDEIQILSAGKDEEYWIELLSSVHYLYKHAYPKVTNPQEAWSILNSVKPLKFSKEDVKTAWSILSKHSLLN